MDGGISSATSRDVVRNLRLQSAFQFGGGSSAHNVLFEEFLSLPAFQSQQEIDLPVQQPPSLAERYRETDKASSKDDDYETREREDDPSIAADNSPPSPVVAQSTEADSGNQDVSDVPAGESREGNVEFALDSGEDGARSDARAAAEPLDSDKQAPVTSDLNGSEVKELASDESVTAANGGDAEKPGQQVEPEETTEDAAVAASADEHRENDDAAQAEQADVHAEFGTEENAQVAAQNSTENEVSAVDGQRDAREANARSVDKAQNVAEAEVNPVQGVARQEEQLDTQDAVDVDDSGDTLLPSTTAENAVVDKPAERNESRSDKWYEHSPDAAQSDRYRAQASTESPEQNAEQAANARLAEQALTEQTAAPGMSTATETPLATSNTGFPESNLMTASDASIAIAAAGAESGGEGTDVLRPGAMEAADRPNRAAASSKQSAETAETGEAPELSQQERMRLIQRISRSFSRLGATGGLINLKLHPPHLGTLNVQVQMEGRKMAARLATENHAAREAILESLPMLRKRLADQGFEISQFQVEVAQNGADASGSGNLGQQAFAQADGFSQQRFRPGHALRTSDRSNPSQAEPVPSPNASQLTWQTLAGIDIHA